MTPSQVNGPGGGEAGVSRAGSRAAPSHKLATGVLPGAFGSELRARWSSAAPRERRLVGLALAALALTLTWLVAVQPAWRVLQTTPARLDALEAQHQQMQRLAAEAQELRKLPVVSPAQADAALVAASERLGPNARLTLQGGRASLEVNGVPGEALLAWLGEVRSAARARPEQLRLTRGPAGYSGSIVLNLARPG